jgi:hypothetical protein
MFRAYTLGQRVKRTKLGIQGFGLVFTGLGFKVHSLRFKVTF